MTDEFEKSALAYQKSSLEWQQRYNLAVAERDALRKERDILAARLEAAIELEAEVSGANRRLVRERDTMRTVCEAAAVYCGNRTVANEHALIDAARAVKFLAVQPNDEPMWKHIEPRDSFEIKWTILP